MSAVQTLTVSADGSRRVSLPGTFGPATATVGRSGELISLSDWFTLDQLVSDGHLTRDVWAGEAGDGLCGRDVYRLAR